MATYIFGAGGPVQPAQPSYADYTDLTTNLELTWASSFVNTNQPEAVNMRFSAVATGIFVRVPNAKEVGVGTAFMAVNVGVNAINFVTYDSAENIMTLQPGDAKNVVLRDNTTADGDWLVVALGSSTSTADANALAGYGLISLPVTGEPNTLNVNFPRMPQGSNIVLTEEFRAEVIYCTNNITITLSYLSINNGFFCYIYAGEASVVLQCQGGTKINGGPPNGNLTLSGGQSCMLVWDGTNNYTTIGLQTFPGAQVTFVTIDMTDQPAALDLSADQLSRTVIIFTGALTQNTTVYFGTGGGQWTVHNTIASADFAITLKGGTIDTPGSSGSLLKSLQCFQVYYNATAADLYVVDPFYNGQAVYIGQPIINTSAGPAYSGLSTSRYSPTVNTTQMPGTAGTNLVALATNPYTPLSNESLIISGVVYAGVGVDMATVTLVRNTNLITGDGPSPLTIELFLGTLVSTNTQISAIPFYYLETNLPDPVTNIYTLTYTVNIAPNTETAVPYLNCSPDNLTPVVPPRSTLAVMGVRGPL